MIWGNTDSRIRVEIADSSDPTPERVGVGSPESPAGGVCVCPQSTVLIDPNQTSVTTDCFSPSSESHSPLNVGWHSYQVRRPTRLSTIVLRDPSAQYSRFRPMDSLKKHGVRNREYYKLNILVDYLWYTQQKVSRTNLAPLV